LNALQTDEKFKVLSTPRIFTSNNVEAEINISQSVPFIVSQREDVNGNFIFNYSFQDVGIVLTVTPRITANGMVTLDVVQTANDLQGFTDFNAPIVNQRQAQTTVSVRDGATIVLGGIMRSQVRSTTKKVPLLGDIPILGELFKSRDKTETKTELLVFLTPRVVRNEEEAEGLKNDQVGSLSKTAREQYEKVRPPVVGGGTTGGAGGTTTGGTTGGK
jgi:general secretion pathway protein D